MDAPLARRLNPRRLSQGGRRRGVQLQPPLRLFGSCEGRLEVGSAASELETSGAQRRVIEELCVSQAGPRR